MELDPPEKAVLDKWGTEDAIYVFLQDELRIISKTCFDGVLSLPNLQIMPMWLSRGIMGETPNKGGHYEPPEADKAAQIVLFSSVLVEEEEAKLVLAHEMIHHWELTSSGGSDKVSYASEIDDLIKNRFPRQVDERRWRGGILRVSSPKPVRLLNVSEYP
jgi:hypothetical protein